MKSFYVFVFAMFTAAIAFGQSVIVKGYVRNSNGAAVINWPVYIMTDTATSPVSCGQYHTKVTNSNGFYIDTLTCSGAIGGVVITTQNCNGAYLNFYDSVPAGRVVEQNFSLCIAGAVSCHAAFTATVAGSTASFNSSASTASTVAGIAQRIWNFGDGSALVTTTNVAVTHAYATAGTYHVGLTIVAANNQCADSVYQNVVITTSPLSCHASFYDSIMPGTASYTVQFFGITSTTGTGDSIVQRRWSFGDNSTPLTGNIINPQHVYAVGTYTACLTIISARGCEDSVCKTITLNSNPQNCIASFTYVRSGVNAISFNSSTSQAVSPDVIVRRKWSFGDGDTLGGNVISPSHTYTHSGSFTACLTTYTQNGCSKIYCLGINIVDSSCHASFTYAANPGTTTVSFVNSSTGSGTALTYAWNFGDSSSSAVASPTHAYNHFGTYYVCLTVYSAGGCQNSVCKQVVVDSAVHTSCNADITANITTSTVGTSLYFSSNNSTTATGDSIIQRAWNFGDGSAAANAATVYHTYTNAGTYTLTLVITSRTGCRDTAVKTIKITAGNTTCHAMFTSNDSINAVKFNSNMSTTATGDTIKTRYWSFGDSTFNGNSVDPTHTYLQSGVYYACLTIVTNSGCQSTYCDTVLIHVAPPACAANFTYVNAGLARVQFNSSNCTVALNDSIIKRRWNFGDGSLMMSSNLVNPVKYYQLLKTYTTCLRITTAKGCVNEICKPVVVSDSTVADTSKKVEIISIYPNPATTQFTAVIWSKYNGVVADLSIVDIYGAKRWISRKVLLNGNNSIVVPTNFLSAGPYTFKLTTVFALRSKSFYKL